MRGGGGGPSGASYSLCLILPTFNQFEKNLKYEDLRPNGLGPNHLNCYGEGVKLVKSNIVTQQCADLFLWTMCAKVKSKGWCRILESDPCKRGVLEAAGPSNAVLLSIHRHGRHKNFSVKENIVG